jgi:hypothetical protein
MTAYRLSNGILYMVILVFTGYTTCECGVWFIYSSFLFQEIGMDVVIDVVLSETTLTLVDQFIIKPKQSICYFFCLV